MVTANGEVKTVPTYGPAFPTDSTPREVYDVAEMLWQVQSNAAGFEREKQKIGDELRKALRIGPVGSYLATSSPIIVIDRSGSLMDKPGVMQQVQSQASQVVQAIQRNVTQAAVINFSGENDVLVGTGFTSDPVLLLQAIQSPGNKRTGTAIYDAIVRAVDLASGSGERTMVVLLTDGVNHGGRKLDDAIRYCRTQKSPIPVIIVGFEGTEGRNDADLTSLAESTGGFYVYSEQSTIEKILQRFRFFSTYKAASKPQGSAN
jgi:Mg-chelatase subunit ChlD